MTTGGQAVVPVDASGYMCKFYYTWSESILGKNK